MRHSSMYGHVCVLLSYLYIHINCHKERPTMLKTATVYRCGTKLRNVLMVEGMLTYVSYEIQIWDSPLVFQAFQLSTKTVMI